MVVVGHVLLLLFCIVVVVVFLKNVSYWDPLVKSVVVVVVAGYKGEVVSLSWAWLCSSLFFPSYNLLMLKGKYGRLSPHITYLLTFSHVPVGLWRLCFYR